ncbi:MAG TPA: NAD-dependent succinate-semialdehyde dehydrogenase [Pseudomonas xinjiangensis]|uniref:NAD-dependent succinate-semialdehyde dehydrogenase n=2 Tax=root TaxID=1 RepID=A0A7V1BPT5_9GAMM|nr:NAD-dependent succinate-semialdehyde dehydrogenase [Halopseudomonas xinjiangensis]HEC48444.1 NAD-dependent succinate-semialdehyde dehydrogenase [Halopseudomonas xinjiangensis]
MPLSRLNSQRLFRQQCYVGGKWLDARDGKTISVDNPATGEVIGSIPSLSAEETDSVIDIAQTAFEQWRSKTALERSDLLMRWYQLMLEHKEDIATLMTLEQGKPMTESRAEVGYAASFIRWYAEEAPRMYGETIPGAKPGQHIVVTRQPAGVAAAITPWNFPAAMITRKAGAALAAGCSFIVKPSESTPFTALAMAELAHEAGIPPGVFNVITGASKIIGKQLTGSPIVRKFSFTGSTGVGSELMAQSAEHIQKVSLELGGNAPFIVFDDADLERAVEGAMVCKFRNTGQTCVCANRILVQASVHEKFVSLLAKAMGDLKLGDGFEEGVSQSALINHAAVEKVQRHYQDAMDKGATHVYGITPDKAQGNFVNPVLITDVTTDMQLCHEETFGPLAAIIKFDTEAEAIKIANGTPFGLAAYFYSRDIHRCWRVADALEAGIIGMNEGAISNPMAPFGGVKASGLGREGSRHGLEEYTELKYICMGAE